MAVTPQTNVTISEFAEYLKQAQSVAICGHVNPDGDCIGSQLALGWALKTLSQLPTMMEHLMLSWQQMFLFLVV